MAILKSFFFNLHLLLGIFPTVTALAAETSHVYFMIMYYNFTNVSVTIALCDSHKNLGRSAVEPLAGQCVWGPAGAQRRQGSSNIPKFESSLFPPAVWYHHSILIC